MHINMPKLTDAHRGPLTPQSAQKRFSVSFNCLRRRFKLESQSSLLVGGLAVKENDAMFSLYKVACVCTCLAFVCKYARLAYSVSQSGRRNAMLVVWHGPFPSMIMPEEGEMIIFGCDDDDVVRVVVSSDVK